ncbi:nicotinate-nucleotide adenylyltransferase [Oscillatoria sp. CS-180]|uniref:nicotinate-nucleotide adenylyltransferase n=1 Tax=Oscillatoria sp. CS-180 TaxID=3021720 RepID=UPI00232EBE3A|nr:nicotinate-nucleotide adenylyltransferase [Oscillatoria sp. CS-180]MDB9525811.1 nicotinate-nucleotide adenylyltransferase [Oscillatoria sp. CS-180]
MQQTNSFKIALFGTSADPPHRGHCEILRWLSTRFDQVAVWAADNPFKEHQSPLRDRAAMLRLMIRDIDAPAGRIALHEELSHSRSLVSAQQARDRWPHAELTLVVGSDLIRQLPRWYKARDLFQIVSILVIPRPGYDLSNHDLMEVQRQGGRVEIANIPETFDVSSTYFRQTEDVDALPTAVRAYIDQKNLYPCPESSKEKQPIS